MYVMNLNFRWKDYSICGTVIPGERLVSFKTPLSKVCIALVYPELVSGKVVEGRQKGGERTTTSYLTNVW